MKRFALLIAGALVFASAADAKGSPQKCEVDALRAAP
jgi:hypothetical protein